MPTGCYAHARTPSARFAEAATPRIASLVLLQHLPLATAIYGVLVFPANWGLTEQMTYGCPISFDTLTHRRGMAVELALKGLVLLTHFRVTDVNSSTKVSTITECWIDRDER